MIHAKVLLLRPEDFIPRQSKQEHFFHVEPTN